MSVSAPYISLYILSHLIDKHLSTCWRKFRDYAPYQCQSNVFPCDLRAYNTYNAKVVKNMLSYDFDLVGSDPSDPNTNSTNLFSDDTDDRTIRSHRGALSHQEKEVRKVL